MDERERISRRVAAFEVLLGALPMAGHPGRGDPETAERALAAIEELRPEQPPHPGDAGG